MHCTQVRWGEKDAEGKSWKSGNDSSQYLQKGVATFFLEQTLPYGRQALLAPQLMPQPP